MTCLNCDKEYLESDSDAEDFEQYCSRQCESEHRQMLEDLEEETNEED